MLASSEPYCALRPKLVVAPGMALPNPHTHWPKIPAFGTPFWKALKNG